MNPVPRLNNSREHTPAPCVYVCVRYCSKNRNIPQRTFLCLPVEVSCGPVGSRLALERYDCNRLWPVEESWFGAANKGWVVAYGGCTILTKLSLTRYTHCFSVSCLFFVALQLFMVVWSLSCDLHALLVHWSTFDAFGRVVTMLNQGHVSRLEI